MTFANRNQSHIAIVLTMMWASDSLAQAVSDEEIKGQPAATERFAREIWPLLDQHCTRCHGADEQEGELRIDRLDADFVNGADVDHWQEVLDRLNLGEMPPEDEPQPTRKEKLALIDWLTQQMQVAIKHRRSNGGQTVIRRMTRYEYGYTMRDLLGIDFNYTDGLPPEGFSADGFQNDGRTLGMSPLQVEMMLKNTLAAMEKVIVSGPAPITYDYHIEPENHQPEFRPSTAEEQTPEALEALTARFNIWHKRNADRVRTTGVNFHPKFTPKQLGKTPEEQDKTRKLYGNVAASAEHPDYVQLDVAHLKEIGLTMYGSTMLRVDIRDFPREGEIEFEIAAAAFAGKDGRMPRLLVEFGHWASGESKPRTAILDVEVQATPERPEVFTVRTRMDDIPLPPELNARVPEMWILIWNKSPTFVDLPRGEGKRFLATVSKQRSDEPKLLIDYVKFRGPSLEGWPPPYHKAILFDNDGLSESEYVREVLRRFMTRAYRRPANDFEVEQAFSLYDKLRPEHNSLEATMRKVLATVLCSPKFLYLAEPVKSAETKPARRKLSDYELATRLSYFLWCSMPDETLFDLAERGQLHLPQVLAEQVSRMLSDPKSSRFADAFVGQWLKLDGLVQVAVNPEYYPDWDEVLKDDMRSETINFVEHALRENLRCDELVDGGYTMLNERLANHYEIPGVFGNHFRRVELKPEYKRGSGMLGHASILLANSNGEHSHPIKRGVWILDRLLGNPPPDPPPGVPDLQQDNPNTSSLSLKQQLELHRADVSCANCHAKIDPWGVALEHYDAVGRWRQFVRTREVATVESNAKKTKKRAQPKWIKQATDARAVLPDGTRFRGIDGLERVLTESHQEQLAEGLAARMMTYALGRSLDVSDGLDMDALMKEWKSKQYRLNDLVLTIVSSEPFQIK